MALQKQMVPLSITDGIDTKTDEKNVLATKWLAAENVDYAKTGSAGKRQGFLPFTRQISGAADLIAGTAAATLQEELLIYSSNKLYSFSENKNRWYDRGYVSNAVSSQKNIDVANSCMVTTGDSATLNGVTCYVYVPDASSTVIKTRIIDDTTGAILADNDVGPANAYFLCIGTVANSFVIFFRAGTDLKYSRIAFTDLDTVTTAVTIGDTNSSFARCAQIGNRLFIVWQNTATGIDFCYIKPDLTAHAPVTITSITMPCVSISVENINNVRICYGDSTVLYDFDLVSQLHAPVTYITGLNATNVTSIQDPDNDNASIILYDDTAAAGQIGVKKSRVTSTGTVTNLGWITYAVNLVSSVQNYNGQLYAVVNKRFNSGSTRLGTLGYFLINIEGKIVAKIAEGVGIRQGGARLATLSLNGTKLSFFGSEYYQAFTAASVNSRTPSAVIKYMFDFSTSSNFYDAVLGKQLHTAGGVLYSYDGNVVNEHGFLEIPSAPTHAEADINPTLGVGNGAACTVQYSIVFAWNDSQGQIHRSAPSTPVSVTIPDSTTKVTLTIRPLTLTSKSNVEVEVYRTEGNGVTFYKCSALAGIGSTNNGLLVNDASTAELTFEDNQPDSSIIDKEVLYTTGGVLENIAPISSRYATTYKNRIVLLSSDGYKLQYSKLYGANVGVEFNDSLIMTLDRFGGPGTALGCLDDNLIIFKERALFLLNGEGPNNLGEQDDFRQPALITSDVGCIDPGSVVSTPSGLMFKSEKGIYILGRNMAVQYIGASVEAYNSYTITSGNLLDTTNQVLFTTAEGTTLVYDYFTNRWSTKENVKAVDGLLYQGRFTYLRDDGTILSESGYSDDGNYIPLVLESSWIQLAGIQGCERFYKMLILGNYLNAHKVKVSFAYDFNDNYVDDVLIDCTSNFDGGVYGDVDYGVGVYGGNANNYQFTVLPRRQKCSSFKFRIETAYDGVYGPDATFSNFMLVLGVKPTTFKNKASLKFGAGEA